MTSESCPRFEELCHFLDGRLSPTRETAIVAHVETCGPCQDQLERITSGRRTSGKTDDRSNGLEIESNGVSGTKSLTMPVGGSTQLSATSATRVAELRLAGGADETIGLAEVSREQPDDTNQATSDSSECDHEKTTLQSDHQPLPAEHGSAIKGASPRPAIPGFELMEKLGEGGMGVVYLARQTGLNRLVAVKMIRGGSGARPDHFARFRIEAEAVARLRHPNIIQIHDIGEVDGLPFVSLELLEGGSLDDRLEGTPQAGRQAAELMATLARAVQVAHDAGIVHRDLKPSNVLFTEDGTPKITDFGLAKRLESDSKQTESGQIMGSPSYMAPEQARGHAKDVGPPADVYALGAILYEMLTGRPPFKGESPIETVRQVIDDELIPPSRLVPRIARDLETICLKCLNKEPTRRYESARALAEDLERYGNGETIHARRTSVLERAVKWARRRPAAAALTGLAIMTSLGLFVGGALFGLHLVSESQRILRVVSAGNRLIDSAKECEVAGAAL